MRERYVSLASATSVSIRSINFLPPDDALFASLQLNSNAIRPISMARTKKATLSAKKNGSLSSGIRSRMAKMRDARKKRAASPSDANAPVVEPENRRDVQNEQLSASAKKIHRVEQYEAETNDGLGDQEIFGQHVWCFMEIGQLNRLLSDVCCPYCQNASVTVSLGEKYGFSRRMMLTCSSPSCMYFKEDTTSPRIFDSDRQDRPFDVNQRAVLYCTETGSGFAALQKLCSIFGMPNLSEKSFQRIQKTVCTATVQTSEMTLNKCRDIVKTVYTETFPFEEQDNISEPPPHDSWEIDDGVPWIDVSFDGTWQRRGHVSHYGVGVVVEMLTGYVVDYHVLSTYCHQCKLREAENLTEEQWEAWMGQHGQECNRNHFGSAKAMEREAALELWTNSVARTGFRYRYVIHCFQQISVFFFFFFFSINGT